MALMHGTLAYCPVIIDYLYGITYLTATPNWIHLVPSCRMTSRPIVLRKALRGIVECGSSLLAISASFSPGFLRTHTPTTITDAVSQHPELFIIRDDSSLHRDSILLTMTFVLCRCPPSLNINLTEYIFNYTKL